MFLKINSSASGTQWEFLKKMQKKKKKEIKKERKKHKQTNNRNQTIDVWN